MPTAGTPLPTTEGSILKAVCGDRVWLKTCVRRLMDVVARNRTGTANSLNTAVTGLPKQVGGGEKGPMAAGNKFRSVTVNLSQQIR